ncbi:U5 snRNP protein, DIM1 family [Strigomonas culicis]|uniref:U5 snRNP protein, DIM1 family n=1 Tax=Strigomonas culicis TaxID=28005 RepID=S9VDU2_9TRYP|nr:U5 snRNP protein, DIM1 family [Strigomonas culicis]EPY27921.1 U5 snRNP protein, DIM1 family [Strigomonas culicis]|eukprot:EPY21240.1 U5 snRNP protein, DIM1 family [Strigomonas culicis]
MELQRLETAWDVDRHIVLNGEKLVIIRFSSFEHPPQELLETMIGGGDAKRTKGEPADGPTAAPRRGSNLAAYSQHYTQTLRMDALLAELAPKVRKYAVIYLVDTNRVTEFHQLYELGHEKDPFAVMFFYRNKHIRVEVGTGNNNKINFYAFEGVDDFLPIVDAAYRAGKVGRTMANSEKKFSTVSLVR